MILHRRFKPSTEKKREWKFRNLFLVIIAALNYRCINEKIHAEET